MNHEDDIFLKALDLPPAKRAAYLAEACGGDAALQARIERLLQADAAATAGFLREPVIQRVDALPSAVEEQPGDRIDRYTLVRRIGEGGCGVVWLAEQAQPVRRTVALKVIKLGMDTAEVIKRFEAERQALALMDHPHIARVYDAGATAKGRPFFVMEYVDGDPITTYCDQHNLSVPDRLALFQRACDAIQHAHRKGIIHRDVKPTNILVATVDGLPMPKVIDFGIAKATEQPLSEATLLTQVGQFLGTPAYMSPEQSALTPGDIDTRTDVYSLGVLLYELLAGKPPFDPQALRGAGLEAMWRQIRDIDPPRPSTRLQTLSPEELSATAARRLAEAPKLIIRVSGDLDWIAMRCLEKDRARRYDSAADLARDIQRHLDNEPVEARPAGAGYRFAKLVRRNRLAFAAAAALALALIAGTVVSTWQAVRANRAEREARVAEQTARDEAAAANAVAGFLVEDMLLQTTAFGQSGDDIDPDLPVRKVLEQAAEKVGERFAEQPLLEARVRFSIADAYLSLSLFTEAAGQFERAAELRSIHLGVQHPDTLKARKQQARCYEQATELEQAQTILLEVVAAYENLPAEDRPGDDYDDARTILALIHRSQGRFADARVVQEQVVDSLTTRHGRENRQTASAIHNLGLTLDDLGELDAAETTLREALTLQEKLYGPHHPELLITRNSLAATLGSRGRTDEAVEMFRAVFEEGRRLLGPEHFRVIVSMSNLAGALDKLGRVNEAMELNEQALEIARRTIGEEHQFTVALLNNLSLQYSRAGRVAESMAMKEQLVDAVAKAFGPDHPNTMILTSNLAWDYLKVGRLAEAEPLFIKAWEGLAAALGDTHPNTLLIHRNLASVWEKMGRWDEAIALRRELWETGRRVLGADSPAAMESGVLLAGSLDEAGRFEEALALWRDLIADTARIHGEDSAKVNSVNGRYASTLLNAGHWTEAEAAWRDLKRVQEERIPDHWATFNAHSALGGALLGQGRYAEAEPLLLSGYEGMRTRREQNLVASRGRLNETFDRLVELYEAWDRPREAARWREEHEAFREAEGE